MAWSDYISRKKEKWIGKKVSFEGKLYTVVDIDMNGALLINKPHYYCESYTAETTAIGEEHIDSNYKVNTKVFATEKEARDFSKDLMAYGGLGGWTKTDEAVNARYLGNLETEPA